MKKYLWVFLLGLMGCDGNPNQTEDLIAKIDTAKYYIKAIKLPKYAYVDIHHTQTTDCYKNVYLGRRCEKLSTHKIGEELEISRITHRNGTKDTTDFDYDELRHKLCDN